MAENTSATFIDRRPIPGYEGYYEIDLLGNVYAMFRYRGKPPGWTKSIGTNPDGYRTVVLKPNQTWTIHRLLMLTFRPVENSHELEVNHKDGNRQNNNLSNLEWMTHRENMQHSHHVLKSFEKGQLYGEQVPSAKLTEDDIREIRRLSAEGLSQRTIARLFKISQVTVSHILSGKTWSHVK